jgi:hypothetical protein
LTFGASSGEGISSQRTSGGNQYGLSFYTANARRLTIANNGNVGIGTDSPTGALLDVEGDIRLNDHDFKLRGGTDNNHGLGWYGPGKTFPCYYVPEFDGAVVYGYFGGVLGSVRNGAQEWALEWMFDGNVSIHNTLYGGSDRNTKANFTSIDPQEVLEKLAAIPISRWNYTNSPSERHIGPMAQDFYAAFNLGGDDKRISMVDADGIALAAIQGLNQVVKEKEARIEKLEKDVAELKAMLKSQQKN